jgi:hypothetical protein
MPEDDDLKDDKADEIEDDQQDEDDDSGDEGDDKGKPKGSDSELARVRREAAGYRRKLREAEKNGSAAEQNALKKIMAALGMGDDGEPDPEKLKAQTKRQADELRESKVELAVYRSASRAGGDPDALLDSRGFLAAVSDLDPTDADFDTQVVDAIKSAVKKNPKLSKAQVAGSSGGEHRGGPGGSGGGNGGGEESADEAYQRVLSRRAKK